MAFDSGRVTFCRLHVVGDAPTQPDDAALSILAEHRFRETEIGAPDEVEAGFITGQHLFDTQFTYEKNAYGNVLLFAVRIDTHKVPSEVKKAYRRMNEQAAAAASPTGFASRAEKKDAKDEAERQLHEDLAKGLYRRSRVVPLMWDLRGGYIYCGASGTTVLEQVARLMKEAFAVDVEYLSAGVAAGLHMRSHGQGRDYEDLKPSPFTQPPPLARQRADDADAGDEATTPHDLQTPLVPWVAKGVDLKDFLGNELLMWLWHQNEAADGVIKAKDGELFIAIDKALDMDCAWEAGGKQTLRGDGPTRLTEAADALRTGKWPRKMGLILSDGEHQWQLTLQGDQWIVSAAALPEIEDAQSPRELIEARILLIRDLAQALDSLYASFLDQRTGGGWPTQRDNIKRWIRERRKPESA